MKSEDRETNNQTPVNDTMIRYTPQTGYPITPATRRKRVMADPDGGMPHDPLGRRLVRYGLQGLAGVFWLGAIGWVGWGLSGHVDGWLNRAEASATIAAIDSDWASDAQVRGGAQDAEPPAPASPPATGQGWAKLSIPAIAVSDLPVVQGTESAQIDAAIGHYEQTSFPWEPGGNTGLAGHRNGPQNFFSKLPELVEGDVVTLQTATAVYRYTVTGSSQVEPDDVWVLDSAPGTLAGTSPDSSLLTLTTCDGPDNTMRLAVWAELSEVKSKA